MAATKKEAASVVVAGESGLEATVRLYQGESSNGSRIVGFADLVIGRAFVIKGIRIVQAKSEGEENRTFLSFPSRKSEASGETRYFDIAHPITAEAYRSASDVVMAAYQRACG